MVIISPSRKQMLNLSPFSIRQSAAREADARGRARSSQRQRLLFQTAVVPPMVAKPTKCRSDANPSVPMPWVSSQRKVGQRVTPSAAGKWSRRRDELLGRLCSQLGGLGNEGRRTVLQQCFTEPQRLALEQWMLKYHGEKPATIRLSGIKRKTMDRLVSEEWLMPPDVPPTRQRSRCRCPTRKSVSDTRRRCSEDHVSLMAQTSFQVDKSSGRGTVCQVALSTGSCSFYALACIGMMRLTSRKSRDYATAVKHRAALASICGHVAAHCGSLEDRLTQALTEVLPTQNFTLAELGLRLSVRLWAYRWVASPLATPSFFATSELGIKKALYAWRRLQSAREAMLISEAEAGGGSTYRGPPSTQERAAWVKLREIFLDIEVEMGLERPVRAARLLRAERARSAHHDKLSEAWNQNRMASEERSQREVASAQQGTCGRLVVAAAQVARRVARLLSNLASVEERLKRVATEAAMVVGRNGNYNFCYHLKPRKSQPRSSCCDLQQVSGHKTSVARTAYVSASFAQKRRQRRQLQQHPWQQPWQQIWQQRRHPQQRYKPH